MGLFGFGSWDSSGDGVRRDTKRLLSRFRRSNVSGHEAPKEMEALLSLWKELDGVEAVDAQNFCTECATYQSTDGLNTD